MISASSGKYRTVNTRFWTDPWILENLGPLQKLLFLYLITNQYNNIAGVYEISLAAIAFETGLSLDQVREFINEFEAKGKVKYLEGWIILRNFAKHQKAWSADVQKGAQRILAALPENVRGAVGTLQGRPCGEGVGTLPTPCIDPVSNSDSDSDSDSVVSVVAGPTTGAAAPQKALQKAKKPGEQPPDARIKHLVDYYHDQYVAKTGQKPVVTGQWGRMFKTLLRAHTEETVKAVVDYFFGYDKRTQLGFNKFVSAFDNLLPAATGHRPRAGPGAIRGWKCECGYLNRHTGGFCLQCRKDKPEGGGG